MKPKTALRDKDEEQQWRSNGGRVDSLNLGVMLAYLQALVVITTFLSERVRSSHSSNTNVKDEDANNEDEF